MTILIHLGLKKVVELLIKNGANINAANKDGNTSLIVSAENGKLTIINVNK